MTPRLKLSWILCFTLSMSLHGRAFEEGNPSNREPLRQEFMTQGKESGEEGRLPEDPRPTGSLNAPTPDQAELDLRVQVLVYNYAQVPAERLTKAAKRAKFIFHKAGVDLLWVEHTLMQKRSGTLRLDDIDLILRILPRPRATLASQSALGEALPCHLSREGCIASVFYNRIQQPIGLGEISSDEVLGHTMAHELGHLLLGSDSHSARGLMQDKWKQHDLRQAGKGDLLFTPEQSEVLRRNVLARGKKT